MKKTKPKPRKTTVSLEIGDSVIKLSEAVFFKRKRVFRLAKRNLSSKEDTNISQEIKNLFDSLNISQRRVLLNIPRHLVMVRFLRFPSISDNEIKNMVKMESVKQMPYATEEIIFGYRIIEKSKDGYSNVLLAIVQANIVNRFVNILKNAGLDIAKIALGSESLFGWYSVVAGRKVGDVNTALINIDAGYIDIDIVKKGNLAFARGFSYRVESKNAIAEIKKSIATFRKESSLDVDKIVISGANNKVNELEPHIKEELGIPLEIIDQTKNIELHKTPDTDLGNTSFIELIGLSLKNGDMKINLLPESMIEANELYFLKKILARTAVLLTCIILIFSGLITEKLSDKSRCLSFLDSKLSLMEPTVTKAKRMKKDIKIVKEEIQKKPLALNIITEIYKITPGGVKFNMLDYRSNRSLILRGNAPSLDDVIKFISILEESQYFENVKMKYTTKRTVRDKRITDFEIVCMLSKVEQI